ncbi:MAG: metal-dependent hydrolase [Candidatus Binatia bacterium]
MALPIAHAAAGYLVHRATRGDSPTRGDRAERVERSERVDTSARPRSSGSFPFSDWRRAALFMLIGNLPDFDFIVGFVAGRPGLFHRGISHTVVAAVAFGVAVGAWCQWRGRARFGPTALAFGACYLSHLVLDAVTIDHRPPFGGQFFWPFSSEYLISPVTIFSEILIDGRTRADFIRTTVNWQTVSVLMREAGIVAATVGAWMLGETWLSRASGRQDFQAERREEDLA